MAGPPFVNQAWLAWARVRIDACDRLGETAGDTAMLAEPSSDREAKPLSAALIGDLLRLADLATVGSVALVVYALYVYPGQGVLSVQYL